MNFGEIVDITKQRIDETDIDEQIDKIIKAAINHAYMFDLSRLEENFKKAYCPCVNGIAKLPKDILSIISISPTLIAGEYRRGNSIISNREETFEILYSVSPKMLIADTDIPALSEKCQFLLSTYACGVYFQYKKKNDVANMYFRMYNNEKENMYLNDGLEEIVIDAYNLGGDN